nr:RNA-directed DNA polymerase, eukaryota [Tanacetum cinerariifolium]
EAQQHHDQTTGGSLIYEHPPIPNPATPPVSITEGAVEATKKLNRDTVLLFHKRIKKLEAKVKTKSKKKLVISDSEEEEAAKDYAELEKLISLAEVVVNKPSSFVTPSKTTATDSSQKEDISPSMVEAAQILTGGKLDPSKISKSPAAVAQRSVQTFMRKRSSKSTQGLDYSDVDFSPRDSEVVPADKGVSATSRNKGNGIAVESSVPQRKQTSQEIEQERLSMLEIDRLKAQDEEERKKRVADLSKSDSEYAKQVALTMETSHAAPAPQVPATGPLPSIERQRDLDDMIASFSNTEWMILMARVKDFLEVTKEILGADVNDDNFSSRLQALVDKRKKASSSSADEKISEVSYYLSESESESKFKTSEYYEKRIQKIDRLARSLLIQGLSNDIYSLIDSNKTVKDLWDALARHMLGSEYGEQDRKAAVLSVVIQKIINKNLMDINIDALYNILKQNQGDVNDAMGSKKKTIVITFDPLALMAEKTKVSKSKEIVVVSSDSEGSKADDFSELKKITALLAKAFNRRKFYSKRR